MEQLPPPLRGYSLYKQRESTEGGCRVRKANKPHILKLCFYVVKHIFFYCTLFKSFVCLQ